MIKLADLANDVGIGYETLGNVLEAVLDKNDTEIVKAADAGRVALARAALRDAPGSDPRDVVLELDLHLMTLRATTGRAGFFAAATRFLYVCPRVEAWERIMGNKEAGRRGWLWANYSPDVHAADIEGALVRYAVEGVLPPLLAGELAEECEGVCVRRVGGEFSVSVDGNVLTRTRLDGGLFVTDVTEHATRENIARARPLVEAYEPCEHARAVVFRLFQM
ncbi:MAG: hypothetical protein ACO32I_06185 [Candidatus Limnocylindrus sp.]